VEENARALSAPELIGADALPGPRAVATLSREAR
jgi:hypothetical protein